ncbi:hypothetical protein [Ruminococcus gauvreauii]|uniref:Uncharacterized protein n=1 Tax=Ruminococcus gauvreauii TaxID=438033 RepID=A0ABY5VH20_9FIRM|nr:hypothetical protein [Ruminococcus gauvreauii]UWP58803.1 hypothetical protein NQ502_15720 [Ruminococcus gauvreauii]
MGERAKKVLIAGGLCGATMLIASDKIKQRCSKENQGISVKIQNLWETGYVEPNYDLIIEMFPYFEDADCPVISGKPFINHIGEKKLIEEIRDILYEKGAAV